MADKYKGNGKPRGQADNAPPPIGTDYPAFGIAPLSTEECAIIEAAGGNVLDYIVLQATTLAMQPMPHVAAQMGDAQGRFPATVVIQFAATVTVPIDRKSFSSIMGADGKPLPGKMATAIPAPGVLRLPIKIDVLTPEVQAWIQAARDYWNAQDSSGMRALGGLIGLLAPKEQEEPDA